jgi:hypothetical protein
MPSLPGAKKGKKMKKMMLLALAVSASLLALPALAAATPAHMKPTANFTVSGLNSVLKTTAGGVTNGKSVTGNGSFENTTTGTVNLTFHGVQSENPVTNCASTGQGHALIAGGGTVTTTNPLPFHLIMVETNKPGILLTPNAQTGIFAHFACAGGLVNVTVTGNGIIGTITSPECGKASNTAKLKFESSSPGHQKHRLWTGTSYDLHTTANSGAPSTFSLDAEATITFAGGATPTLECTH